MADLIREVGRFRSWAGENPPATRSREQPLHHADVEWESDYPYWVELHDAVMEFVDASPPARWSDEQRRAILYALARDHEDQHLAGEICQHHPATLLSLARAATVEGDVDARWQFADQLGNLRSDLAAVEPLLLVFIRDKEEYVRRRALNSLTRIGSPSAEPLAIEAWHRPDEHQEKARMQVLDCLRILGSPHLELLLNEAEQDERRYVREFANRIRQGLHNQ